MMAIQSEMAMREAMLPKAELDPDQPPYKVYKVFHEVYSSQCRPTWYYVYSSLLLPHSTKLRLPHSIGLSRLQHESDLIGQGNVYCQSHKYKI